ELGLCLREPRVGVQRMVVHRDHAEQVVVVFGDRLPGPVLVDVAGLEVLEVATERALVNSHARRLPRRHFDASSARANNPRAITRRWISLVPSPMIINGASRSCRWTGSSVVYPTPPWMRIESLASSNAVSLANSFAIP